MHTISAVQRQNAVTRKTVILKEKQKTNFLQLKQQMILLLLLVCLCQFSVLNNLFAVDAFDTCLCHSPKSLFTVIWRGISFDNAFKIQWQNTVSSRFLLFKLLLS